MVKCKGEEKFAGAIKRLPRFGSQRRLGIAVSSIIRRYCCGTHPSVQLHIFIMQPLPSPLIPVGAETIRTLNELPLNLIAVGVLFADCFVCEIHMEVGSGRSEWPL